MEEEQREFTKMSPGAEAEDGNRCIRKKTQISHSEVCVLMAVRIRIHAFVCVPCTRTHTHFIFAVQALRERHTGKGPVLELPSRQGLIPPPTFFLILPSVGEKAQKQEPCK